MLVRHVQVGKVSKICFLLMFTPMNIYTESATANATDNCKLTQHDVMSYTEICRT